MSDTKTETKLPAGLTDLGKPSLENLSYALRHPDTWPPGFSWDFSYCEQCAMGLAYKLWNGIVPQGSNDRNEGSSKMARQFAIPFEQAKHIFFGPYIGIRRGLFKATEFSLRCADITPEMVASRIDEYLATVK